MTSAMQRFVVTTLTVVVVLRQHVCSGQFGPYRRPPRMPLPPPPPYGYPPPPFPPPYPPGPFDYPPQYPPGPGDYPPYPPPNFPPPDYPPNFNNPYPPPYPYPEPSGYPPYGGFQPPPYYPPTGGYAPAYGYNTYPPPPPQSGGFSGGFPSGSAGGPFGGIPRPEAQVAEAGQLDMHRVPQGTRAIADLLDSMGKPFQGNSALSNLMPNGGGALGDISGAIRGTAQIMEQGMGTMNQLQGMFG